MGNRFVVACSFLLAAVITSGTGAAGFVAPNGSEPSRDLVGATALNRIYGQDAIDTSIAISHGAFPQGGSAGAVVLARSDHFADALAGGPLAAAYRGPLLITPGASLRGSLDPRVMNEIRRVLAAHGKVFVLGGPLALNPSIDDELRGLGFTVSRVQGANQYATAVAIAGQLGNPTTVFEATGLNFADALSAVPAAIAAGGAILLTNGTQQAPETAAYMAAVHPSLRYAIGGPLAAYGADPSATPIYGEDLYGTSATVASFFFPDPARFGVATGADFPDALSGGVFMANSPLSLQSAASVSGTAQGASGPMLLVPRGGGLPEAIAGYFATLNPQASGTGFGGPLAFAESVFQSISDAIQAGYESHCSTGKVTGGKDISAIWPVFNFNDACIAHDACYDNPPGGRNATAREDCDNRFLNAMKASCTRPPYNLGLTVPTGNPRTAEVQGLACTAIALVYYGFVRTFGGSPQEFYNYPPDTPTIYRVGPVCPASVRLYVAITSTHQTGFEIEEWFYEAQIYRTWMFETKYTDFSVDVPIGYLAGSHHRFRIRAINNAYDADNASDWRYASPWSNSMDASFTCAASSDDGQQAADAEIPNIAI